MNLMKLNLSIAALLFRKYGQLAIAAIIWFFHLLTDVIGMSIRLSLHL